MLSNQQVTEAMIEAGAKELCEMMGGKWSKKGDKALFRGRAYAVLEGAMTQAQPLPSGYEELVEEWSLTFYGSPPSVMVRAGIPGLPDSRRDIAFMEFASAGDRSVQGAALSTMVGAHNEAITTLAAKLEEAERERDDALREYAEREMRSALQQPNGGSR